MEKTKEFIPGRLYSDSNYLDKDAAILRFVCRTEDSLLFTYHSGDTCYVEDEVGYIGFTEESEWYDCTDTLNKDNSPTT
jgi:hypothetical protein